MPAWISALGRWALAVLIVAASTMPRFMQGRRGEIRLAGKSAEVGSNSSWHHISAEPYKVAVGAFFALSIQKLYDTAIEHWNSNPPTVDFRSLPATIDPGDGGEILLLQMAAILTWLSLYHLNNVRLYFSVPDTTPFRRTLTYIALTVALGLFYFLSATAGRPSSNQVAIIFAIVSIDAVFPLILGETIPKKTRIVWVGRGILQAGFVLILLVKVSESGYHNVWWSVAFLAVMLVQLAILAPLDSKFLHRKRIDA